MSESSRVIPAALVEFTSRGARIFRNFVGGVWAGKKIAEGPDWVKIKGARHIAAGLRPGSSDLIGWTPVTVGPEHVGQTWAVFTAVECKTDSYKTLTEDQINFLDQVVAAGGLGYVAREDGPGIRVETWPPTREEKPLTKRNRGARV